MDQRRSEKRITSLAGLPCKLGLFERDDLRGSLQMDQRQADRELTTLSELPRRSGFLTRNSAEARQRGGSEQMDKARADRELEILAELPRGSAGFLKRRGGPAEPWKRRRPAAAGGVAAAHVAVGDGAVAGEAESALRRRLQEAAGDLRRRRSGAMRQVQRALKGKAHPSSMK
jgi:hypothetical protein